MSGSWQSSRFLVCTQRFERPTGTQQLRADGPSTQPPLDLQQLRGGERKGGSSVRDERPGGQRLAGDSGQR